MNLIIIGERVRAAERVGGWRIIQEAGSFLGVNRAAEQRIVSKLSPRRTPAPVTAFTLSAQGTGHSERKYRPRRKKPSGHELSIDAEFINHQANGDTHHSFLSCQVSTFC